MSRFHTALLLLTILFISSTLSFTTNPDGTLDSSAIWDKYRSELITFLSKGTNDPNMSKLQLLSSPINVEWDSNPEQFQMFANSRMENVPNWQLDMRTFSSIYEEFLLSLSGNPKGSSKELELLYDQEAEKLNAYEMQMGRCFMQYESLNEGVRGTFDSFKANMCWSLGRSYQEYLALRARIASVGRQTYKSEKEYQLAKALGKFGMAYKKDFIEITTLADFVRRNNAGKYNKFELSVDENTSSSEGKSSYSKTSFNLGFPGFFSIGYNSAKNSMKLTTKKNQFKMKFGAQSWTAIRVMPDPKWFSGNLLQEWASGPYKSHSQSYFFGKNGKMALVPQTFYVISKPHVELVLNRDDYEKMESAKKSGFSISIGPVMFGLNKAKTTAKLDEKNNLFQFKIEGNDETPQLIAVKGDVLPF